MNKTSGFTLIEIAIVLLIISFALGSLLIPLSSSLEQKSIDKAIVQVDELKQATINFVTTNGNLPCPDTNNDGIEERTDNINCDNPLGTIPFVTLGSPHGTDPWGQPFIYRVTAAFADTTNGTACGTNTTNTSISLCSNADGDINVQGWNLSPPVGATQLANGVPAVILSTGRPLSIGPSALEQENTDNDVLYSKTNYGGPNSSMPFNDIVEWISANQLIGVLVRTQQLP